MYKVVPATIIKRDCHSYWVNINVWNMNVHVQCIVFSHHILLFVQCEVTKDPYTSILIISLIWVYTFHLCMTIYIHA